MKNSLFIICFGFYIIACNSLKKNQWDTPNWNTVGWSDSTVLDSSILDYTLPYFDSVNKNETYNWYSNFKNSTPKIWELVHTNLRINLNFKTKQINGTADLTLHPYFYSQDSLVLDAKNMDISYVKNLELKDIKFKYLNPYLIIYFNKEIVQKDTQIIRIEYVTKGTSKDLEFESAIRSDAGYYFINENLDIKKPLQFWTQGEAESNCNWFPTLDAPNQKHTQTIEVETPLGLNVLSNGILKSTQTMGEFQLVTYEQKKPHAVYLTMLAVGNFDITNTKWQNIPISYWVEPYFVKYATSVFNNTPEIMQFFSEYTGVVYPWDKYTQVVVRDFVSGAMENTSATVHMEQLQQTPGEKFDQDLENYVSHELFHQWFGNLVTASSWSNIAVNESFATYGEYLWTEFKYGQTAADNLIIRMQNTVNLNPNNEEKSIIQHNYNSPDRLFNALSYDKGGLALHQLRCELGNEGFKKGLFTYLKTFAFKSADITNVRQSFETATGKELKWFFDRWFERPGMPLVHISLNKNMDNWILKIDQDNTDFFPFTLSYLTKNTTGIWEQSTIFIDKQNKEIVFKTKPIIAIGGPVATSVPITLNINVISILSKVEIEEILNLKTIATNYKIPYLKSQLKNMELIAWENNLTTVLNSKNLSYIGSYLDFLADVSSNKKVKESTITAILKNKYVSYINKYEFLKTGYGDSNYLSNETKTDLILGKSNVVSEFLITNADSNSLSLKTIDGLLALDEGGRHFELVIYLLKYSLDDVLTIKAISKFIHSPFAVSYWQNEYYQDLLFNTWSGKRNKNVKFKEVIYQNNKLKSFFENKLLNK